MLDVRCSMFISPSGANSLALMGQGGGCSDNVLCVSRQQVIPPEKKRGAVVVTLDIHRAYYL